MSKVDWSLAPNWCKGYGLIGIAQFAVWFDDYYYEYIASGKKHAFDDGCTFKKSDFSFTEARPVKLQSWSGEKDGLPPVGTVCEFYECGEWREVEVMYLSAHTILLKFKSDEHDDPEGAYSPEDLKLRPIRTPEQLAAEEREAKIEEYAQLVLDGRGGRTGIEHSRIVAAWIYDAGFKREVK